MHILFENLENRITSMVWDKDKAQFTIIMRESIWQQHISGKVSGLAHYKNCSINDR